MRAIRRLHVIEIMASVLLLIVPAGAVRSETTHALESGAAAGVIDGTGRLAGLSVTDKAGLVRGPVRVTVSDVLAGRSVVLGARPVKIERTGTSLTFPCAAKELDLDLEQVFELGDSLRWTGARRRRSSPRRARIRIGRTVGSSPTGTTAGTRECDGGCQLRACTARSGTWE